MSEEELRSHLEPLNQQGENNLPRCQQDRNENSNFNKFLRCPLGATTLLARNEHSNVGVEGAFQTKCRKWVPEKSDRKVLKIEATFKWS